VNPVSHVPQALEAEQFLAALVESSRYAISGLTTEGRVVSWNAGAERLYGYKAAEMLGHTPAVLYPPSRAEEGPVLLARVCSGETVQDLLTERLRKDGRLVAMSVTVSPVFDPDGTVVGISAISRDVSPYVEVVEELNRAQRSAAEALSLLETIQQKAPVGFGFVDREFRFVRMNEMLAIVNGSSIHEQVGRTVAEVNPKVWPQVEAIYRRVIENGESFLDTEISDEVASEPGVLHHWLTSHYPVRVADEIIGVGVVMVDITERKTAERAQKALTRAAIEAIAATSEARDPYTAGHQSRVAALASFIAAALGLDSDTIEGVDLAARIHDVGKIAVPAEILTKATQLSPPEWELIKTHSRVGADIIRGIEFPWPIVTMIEQHHERLDGSGYPDGLRDGEICLGARIIAVADVVEAMASHRPYRPAKGVQAALNEIGSGSGRLYDSAVAEACLRLFREGHHSLDEYA